MLTAKAQAALRVGVTTAAHDFVRVSQAETPVKTGTLRASIHVAGITGGGSSITAKVATGAEAGAYAVAVHEGAAGRIIRPVNAKALAFNGIVVKSVNWPGFAGRHYMSRPLAAMAGTYAKFIADAARAEF